jgi:tRNA pseudouridine38-40 synthase
MAINRILPRDLKIKRAREAPLDFHARFSAQSRVYHYTLYTARHPSVWQTRFACHAPARHNVEAMIEAAQVLKGEHDFRAFCADPTEYRTTVRTLYRMEIRQREHFLTLIFEGSAFMRGMVRMLAGALVLIGRGKQKQDYVQRLLASETERVAYVMPPQGLCLMRVKY